MKKVGSVVQELAKGQKLRRSIRLGEIWLSWSKIVGTDLVARVRPVKVVGRRLYVEVDSAATHHKMSFLKEDMLGRVRAVTGGRYVQDIVFQASPKRKRQ